MDDLNSWLDQARQLRDQDDLAGAAELYRKVLQHDPEQAEAFFELGTCALRMGAAEEAIPLLKMASRLAPTSPDVLVNLGAAHLSVADRGAAEAAWDDALKLDPGHAQALANLGDMARAAGDRDRAARLYGRSLERDPSDGETAFSLGEILFAREQWLGAEECFSLSLRTGFAGQLGITETDLLNRIGLCRLRREQLEPAVAVFQHILTIDPQLAEVYANLSFAFERMGRIPEAIDAAQAAIRLKPGFASAYNNLAVALRAGHRLDEAIQILELARQIDPHSPLLAFNHGTICLLDGRYQEGWPGYESRELTGPVLHRKFECRRWKGESLAGKTLLIYSDQGFGDCLQFVRFLPELKMYQPQRVILESPPQLLRLLKQLPDADAICLAGDAIPKADFEVPLASLPGLLGVSAEQLPGQIPYLLPDAQLQLTWRSRLRSLADKQSSPKGKAAERTSAEKGAVTGGSHTAQEDPAPRTGFRRPKVGIVWQGNPGQSQDVVRSCPLEKLRPLMEVEEIDWFSLQKGEPGEKQLRDISNEDLRLIPLGSELQDFQDTAAVLAELDLLITVDTAVAHLAGAMGRPVWVLLCHTPDWRWHLKRTDSPWYPTLRLFRQSAWGDWESVIRAVRQALQDELLPSQPREEGSDTRAA